MQILERYFLRDANINLRDAKQDLRDARYALREFECDTPRGLYCSMWKNQKNAFITFLLF